MDLYQHTMLYQKLLQTAHNLTHPPDAEHPCATMNYIISVSTRYYIVHGCACALRIAQPLPSLVPSSKSPLCRIRNETLAPCHFRFWRWGLDSRAGVHYLEIAPGWDSSCWWSSRYSLFSLSYCHKSVHRVIHVSVSSRGHPRGWELRLHYKRIM